MKSDRHSDRGGYEEGTIPIKMSGHGWASDRDSEGIVWFWPGSPPAREDKKKVPLSSPFP